MERLDFLLNRARWAFDAEERYTVALLVSAAAQPKGEYSFRVAGVADSLTSFNLQSASDGLSLALPALGPDLEVPLLPTQAEADLLGKLRLKQPFPLGTGRWLCFPTRELHETDDKKLWEGATDGQPLWKGESFDQYDPHGSEQRWCPDSPDVRARSRRPRAGSESMLADKLSLRDRVAAHLVEAERTRVAFRDATNRTNARTVIGALIPPGTLLVNSAPYLVFPENRDLDRACCLGLLNSLVFDWQARRFVETHVSYFILEGLRLPVLDDATYDAIAAAAARLSCPDERFADFASATGVEVGPLSSSG